MNLADDIAFIAKLTKAGAGAAGAQALMSATTQFMQIAEATGEDGATKLQMVEEKAQVFLSTFLPEVGVKWDEMAADFRDMVNLLVSAYNAAKGWFADVEHLFGVKS